MKKKKKKKKKKAGGGLPYGEDEEQLVDRRLMGVLAIGGLIAALCGWRIANNQPQNFQAQLREVVLPRPVVAFEGWDQQSRMFRLDKFLHRHTIIVLFLGEPDAGGEQALAALESRHAELLQAGIKVVAVSCETPYQLRQHTWAKATIPIVADPERAAHRAWGRTESRRVAAHPDQPPQLVAIPGVFLVDRKGEVPARGDFPLPATDVATVLKQTLR